MKALLTDIVNDFKTFGMFQKIVFITFSLLVALVVLLGFSLLFAMAFGHATGNNIPFV